jgi:hypothetical protein
VNRRCTCRCTCCSMLAILSLVCLLDVAILQRVNIFILNGTSKQLFFSIFFNI